MWQLLGYTVVLCLTFTHSQYYLLDQTLGCDGVIGSGKRLDRCGKCGGDNTSCQVISGIFTKRTSKAAYEFITEFPRGAENINITEAKNTRNYLALRYSSTNGSIINGNWSLDGSGTYNVLGTTLVYQKPRHQGTGETIYIRGPIQEEIQLLLLVQTRNPGIYYRYTLSIEPRGPAGSPAAPVGGGKSVYGNRLDLPEYLQDSLGRSVSSQPKSSPSVSYQWRVITDDECSRPCGEGYKEKRVVCVLIASKVTVTEENCRSQPKPQVQRVKCNTQPCSPEWEVGSWSECSATCGRSTQTRSVTCRKRVSSTQIISVSAVNCDWTRKPSTIKMCSNIQECHTWKYSQWSQCSARCGAGRKQRAINCVNSEGVVVDEGKCTMDKPRHTERCYSSCDTTWFFSDWLNKCADVCGKGNQTREIYCPADEGSYSHLRSSSLCGSPPERSQACESRAECKNIGSWFVGEWSKCSGDCNEGYQRRHVFCMTIEGSRSQVVDDDMCSLTDKPAHKQKCRPSECDQTQALWFSTDWSDCSVSCGDGHQRRQVKCLYNNKEDNSCLQTTKPSIAKACSMVKCPVVDRYTDPGCTDKYRSCQVVVQARLCKLTYYSNICCNSCRLADLA